MIYQTENFENDLGYRSIRLTELFMSEHIHNYSETLYCISGSADITIKGKKTVLRNGELIFVPPNVVHEYRIQNCNVLLIAFSNGYLHTFFKELGERELVIKPVDISDIPYLKNKLLELDSSSPLSASSCIHLICEKVMETAQFEKSTPHDAELYQNVISYVSKHYTEKITLESVARVFGYNVKYLSTALHSLLGINFRRFISLYRIDHAKRLLETTDLSMLEVAYSSGFSALSSFNRIFSESLGVTPLEYRKKYRRRL